MCQFEVIDHEFDSSSLCFYHCNLHQRLSDIFISQKNLSPVKGRVHVCVQTDETLCDILKDNLYDVYYLDDETELREIELDFGEHANQETKLTSNNEIVNSIGDINECEHLDKCPINVSCIAQALVDKIEEKAIDAYFQKSLSHRQRAR